MNKLKIIIVFSLFNFFSNAQINPDKGVVFYSQIESFLIGSKKGPDVLSCLVFNKTESSYTTKKDSLSALMQTELKEFYKNESGGGAIYMGGISTSEHGLQVYTNLMKDSVWSSSRWMVFSYVKEKKVNINWKLFPETKKIGTFECHKAVGTLRGREYTAWYTNDIPVPYGPWKLQGLPGLILEAYDENQEVYFCMSKLEYPTKNPTIVSKLKLEEGKNWITFNQYLKLCDENLNAIYEKGILMGVSMIKSTKKEVFKEFSE